MIITVLSDSPFIPTGYRNQMTQLVEYLRDQGHVIHYLANAHMGMTLSGAKLPEGKVFDYFIHGHFGNNQYFQHTLSQHLKETKSDRLIILLDTFMLYPWFLNVDTSPAKTYFWFPTDGGAGMPKGCENILKKVDCPVAMSRFGQKQVKDYHDIEVKHIPHGTDPSKFFRLPDEMRQELKAKRGLAGKFVIGVVARNQPRKHLDRTIKTMALLKDKIPNAVLLLHLDPEDAAQPIFQIKSLVQRYNLENRVFYTGMKAHSGFPDNEMNNVYNLMDVFFLSTSGEGFGIPIIESMACEVPVVATNYTTTQELVVDNKAGYGIKLSGSKEVDMFAMSSQEYDQSVMDGTLTGSWEVERGVCSVSDASKKIKQIYDNPEEAKQMGKNGRTAVLEKYDFDKVVAPMWEELLK